MESTTTIGRQGEDLAVDWLRAHGYTIVARNYRRRFGEVDVIAHQGEYLVFVEVKTRSSGRFGSPFDAVTLRKQQQLSRIAKDYLVRNKKMDTPCRFDVLSIILAEDRPPTVDIIVNAFEYID
ncbi:MAG TPA: YraN family protein [Desulfobulbaceae bacterium]|nr:YraN family protein [Desulfobulbaceae bacterium]